VSRLTRSRRLLSCAGAISLLTLAPCSDSTNPKHTLTLSVSGVGNGTGQVNSLDQSFFPLACALSPSNRTCSTTSVTVGAHESIGPLQIQAIPADGSAFASWSGCSSTSEDRCYLAFNASSGDTTFHVIATFVVANTMPVVLRNDTPEVANIVVPGEAPSINNRLQSGESRMAQIDSTVGSAPLFSAYVNGDVAASMRCTVTVAAWQADTQPRVTLYGDFADGYGLTCEGF